MTFAQDGQITWIVPSAYKNATTARQCESRYKLEVDHQIAFANGGGHRDSSLNTLPVLSQRHESLFVDAL
jgi:hypothetical protein